MKTIGFKAFSMAFALGLGFMGSMAAIPESAHPDFDLSKIPFPEKYKTMGLAFLKDGRMVLATTDFIGGGEVPAAGSDKHKIYLVSGATGAAPTNIQMVEISNNWLQIAGIVVANEKLYVSDRDGFYEINQLSAPADLKTNRRLIVKWPNENTWNNNSFQWHQWVFTPMYKGGSFYGPYSGSIRPGGPSDVNQTTKSAGAFLKCDLTGKIENFAGGLRSPNGANLDEATGEMAVTDNQGSWLPSSTFAFMKQGYWFGHNNVSVATPTKPIVIKAGVYAGDWLLGDVNNPGLMRISIDRVGTGTPNGAVFWFSKGFGNSAINRMAYGPDGASRFDLSRGNARAGLHLLRVSTRSGDVVRKVVF